MNMHRQLYQFLLINIILLISSTVFAQDAINTKYYQILQKVAELDTRQVSENAFNPGMMINPYNPDEYLITLRRETHADANSRPMNTTWLGVLNNKFELQKTFTLDFGKLSGAYDATLFIYKNNQYVCYSGADNNINSKRIIAVSKLKHTINTFYLTQQNLIVYEDGKKLVQKNWSPFVAGDKVYFVYSISPHIILEWQADSNHIINTIKTTSTFATEWGYGQPHGGTPPIYIKEHDCYLAIFQSHLKTKPPRVRWMSRWRKYYIGAYIFEAKPPFKIIAYTNKPLSYPGLYETDCEKDCRIIFPRGLVDKGDHFLISAGLDDYRSIILKLDKKDLWDNLTYLQKQL